MLHPFLAEHMTDVVVAMNRRLTVNVSGSLIVFAEGDIVSVPTFEVARLRRHGVIL